MGDFTRYITKNGDRWDSIAWAAYGDVAKQKDIMDANPDIALLTAFGDGVTLILPIIPEVNTQSSLLPPWKRDGNNTEVTINVLITERADQSLKSSRRGGLDFDDEFDYNFDLVISS